MLMIQRHGDRTTHVVDQFEATDLGAPFKVILKDSVRVVTDAETGELISYTIPDPDGLLRAVAVTRVIHPRKLSGADIRFLRKAVGIKQKELAKAIELSPEHVSKVEAGSLPIGPGSEKLLRIFMLKTAVKHDQIKECDAKATFEALLDRLFEQLTPVSVHDAERELVLSFVRRSSLHADNDGVDDGCWDELAV